MESKDILLKEQSERVLKLKEEEDKISKSIEDKKKDLKELDELHKMEGESVGVDPIYAVEAEYDGIHVFIHKKGDEVRIFSDEMKDITYPFPIIVKQAKGIVGHDYIIECYMVPYEKGNLLGKKIAIKYINAVKSKKDIDDSGFIIHCFDIQYYDDMDVTGHRWYERKKLLEQFHFTDNIKKVKSLVVNNPNDMKKAIEIVSEPGFSIGAIIKRVDASYKVSNKSNTITTFNVETAIDVVVIDSNFKNDKFKYDIGIYLSDDDKRMISEEKIIDINERSALALSETLETERNISKGDIVKVRVSEIIRHNSNNKYWYSMTDAEVVSNINAESTSSLEHLDNIVVENGTEVIEQGLDFNRILVEGKEIETMNFPKRVQDNFNKVKKAKVKLPFMIDWHYRGHKITEQERKKENIPSKYEYKMDSLHTDARHWVNPEGKYADGETININDSRIESGYIEGMTILTPTSTEDSKDMLIKGDDAKKGKIRAVMKPKEPSSWLKYEQVIDIGSPGSTPKSPATIIIVAKGQYTVHDVDDHRIRIEYFCNKGKVNSSLLEEAEKKGILIPKNPPSELKDLNGVWQYQIAHIGLKYIMLLRLLESRKSTELSDMMRIIRAAMSESNNNTLTERQITGIYENSVMDMSRRKIAELNETCTSSVYLWQRKLKLI